MSVTQMYFDTEAAVNAVAQFLDERGIEFASVTTADHATACSDVAKVRGISEKEVGKTMVLCQKHKKQSPSPWHVVLLCGHQQIDWEKMQEIAVDLPNGKRLSSVRARHLDESGIPVGSISPPQFHKCNEVVHFYVDREVLEQRVLDISSGLDQRGFQLPPSSIKALADSLKMNIVDVTHRSDLSFSYPLANRLTDNQKRRHLELLLLLVREDGLFCDAERGFMDDLASRLGADASDLTMMESDIAAADPIDARAREMELISQIRSDHDESEWVVLDLYLIALADEHLDGREESKIADWARMLGLSDSEDDGIKHLARFVHSHDPDELQMVSAPIRMHFESVIRSVL